MAKSFDDEFYYDYKPKDRKDNIDIDVDVERDLHKII